MLRRNTRAHFSSSCLGRVTSDILESTRIRRDMGRQANRAAICFAMQQIRNRAMANFAGVERN
jgi:hypothetical protein